MNKLITELQRLYFLDNQRWNGEGALTAEIVATGVAGERSVAFDLVGADGRVRALVVEFEKAAAWQHAARLYQAVQDELGWPAPALSISGHQGYALWFSLADALPVAKAAAFLAALRNSYLADLPANRLGLRPAVDTIARVTLTPGRHPASGSWAAFIDPSLGGMFIDEPWLEMAPNQDKQAELLTALKSISVAEFQAALSALHSASPIKPAPIDAEPASPGVVAARRRSSLNVGSDYRDPQTFLLAVMNDSSASARRRIAAAKALLPCFPAGKSRCERDNDHQN